MNECMKRIELSKTPLFSNLSEETFVSLVFVIASPATAAAAAG